MATTTYLGMDLMEEGQASKHITFNAALGTLDQTISRMRKVAVKTSAYTITADDQGIISQHTAAVTYTLPALTGLVVGKTFTVLDASASGAWTYPITVAAPGGVTLNGVTAGAHVIRATGGHVVIMYDGAGYIVLSATPFYSKHYHADPSGIVIQPKAGPIAGSAAGPCPVVSAISAPVTREIICGYIPFIIPERLPIKGIYVPFNNGGTGYAGVRIRLAVMGRDGWMYTGGSETGQPTTVVPGLSMAAAVTLQSGRDNLGASDRRGMQFNFDNWRWISAGFAGYLAIMAELQYTGGLTPDTAWPSQFYWYDLLPLPTACAPAQGSSPRPFYFNVLRTGGINAESWATFENPATGSLQSNQPQTTQTIPIQGGGTRSVAIGAINGLAWDWVLQ